MANLTPEERARGVIAASAGNHAQGVALAASKLGCRAVIVMPITAPALKINTVRRLGAKSSSSVSPSATPPLMQKSFRLKKV